MRSGRSHFGGVKTTWYAPVPPFGISHKTIAKKKTTKMKVARRPKGARSKNDANVRNAAMPASALTIQFLRDAAIEYARQNAPTAIIPARVPIAALAAKIFPCSSARKTETGPEVSGKPATAPLTAGPQRRPINVSAAMSSGVSKSLIRRMSITSVDGVFG